MGKTSVVEVAEVTPLPVPEAGLMASPVLVIPEGRGKLGKSTISDFLVQRAAHQKRQVRVADGDMLNSTLKARYPQASQPKGADPAYVQAWLTEELNQMAETGQSLVVDLGAGTGVLAEFSRDLDLGEFCRGVGMRSLAIYCVGPDKDDFDHALAIHKAKHFAADHEIVLLNEAWVGRGENPETAFARHVTTDAFNTWVEEDGAAAVVMPRLPCMKDVLDAGVGFYEAIEPNCRKLGPVQKAMVRAWVNRLEAQFAKHGVTDWLP